VVDTGICANAARDLNSGFFMRVIQERPEVTLKAATSLDGKIATHTGESRWITGEAARARGHGLRARYDAILVGAGTVIADNPQLTCRLPGLEDRSPVRIIVDGHISFPLTAGVVATALTTPTWVITLPTADSNRRKALLDSGVRIIEVLPDSAGKPNLRQALKELGALGLTRLLVEGGSRIAGALIRYGLVDRVIWFRAPLLLGGDGVPVISGFGVDGIGQAPVLRRSGVSRIGADVMETYTVERSFDGDSSDQSGVKA
jgi:diaminohydroxyphosphoribosylaminopyrimidine deaminase/5-amino-6-(5-phosphoribosylamino)uracil reductase